MITTELIHLHRDDYPRTIELLEAIIGNRTVQRISWTRTESGYYVDWDELQASYLSSTEKAAVHIARGCAVLERNGGLPPRLALVVTETIRSVS